MKSYDFCEILTDIREDYIAKARTPRAHRMSEFVKWGSVAACVCFVAAVVLLLRPFLSISGEPDDTNPAYGVTIPPIEISLSADEEADMIGFFIYQGRCYVQHEWLKDRADIVGEYCGTATGLIDEWTPRDGYVELAGSVRGDFYTVRGYDPSFMLCMPREGGAVCTYVCDNGITLRYGRELYEERLHLTENLQAIQYETRQSWYEGCGEMRTLTDTRHSAVAAFLAALNEAECLPWSDVTARLGETEVSVYDTELYHLYLEPEGSLPIHLRLYTGGYVRYQGLLSVCVQVPSEVFAELLNMLQ